MTSQAWVPIETSLLCIYAYNVRFSANARVRQNDKHYLGFETVFTIISHYELKGVFKYLKGAL